MAGAYPLGSKRRERDLSGKKGKRGGEPKKAAPLKNLPGKKRRTKQEGLVPTGFKKEDQDSKGFKNEDQGLKGFKIEDS
jgi:hypothetical protein